MLHAAAVRLMIINVMFVRVVFCYLFVHVLTILFGYCRFSCCGVAVPFCLLLFRGHLLQLSFILMLIVFSQLLSSVWLCLFHSYLFFLIVVGNDVLLLMMLICC